MHVSLHHDAQDLSESFRFSQLQIVLSRAELLKISSACESSGELDAINVFLKVDLGWAPRSEFLTSGLGDTSATGPRITLWEAKF